ncbi:MAG: hypothetical protein E6H66_24665 [Betaproteobacteria bacterium]|nr:MAG: hypothetical protein E6H66_24665 [Betaproteobacteria bacterium]
MNSMRKIIFFFFSMAIAAFALPSFGDPPPNKLFSVTMVPGQLDTLQGTTPVTAYVTNESPAGSNASFSSFTLSLSSVSGLTIQSVDQPSGGGFAQVTSPTSISVTGIPNVKPQDPPFTVTMHVVGCGDGSTWTPTIYTGSNLSGFVFVQDSRTPSLLTTDVACGSVSCAGALAKVTQPDGTITGVRGSYNQDGTTCTTAVNYFVTNTISVNGTLKFRWDLAAAPQAAFRYSLWSDAAASVPINWTANAKVAWLCDPAGDPNSKCWVPAQPCERPTLQAEPYLPWPYASLIADNGKTIKVDPSAFSSTNPVPALPFPIFVETERMLVTKINSSTNTWTVQRCQGGTCTSTSTHPQGVNVMSTPLPILPSGTQSPYKAGNQAQACIVPGTNNLVDIGDLWSEP